MEQSLRIRMQCRNFILGQRIHNRRRLLLLLLFIQNNFRTLSSMYKPNSTEHPARAGLEGSTAKEGHTIGEEKTKERVHDHDACSRRISFSGRGNPTSGGNDFTRSFFHSYQGSLRL